VGELLKKNDIDPASLLDVLCDEQRAPDHQLPDTGLDLERERELSSMFIKSPDYGSRCSTVILIDRNNEVLFSERVYDLKTFEHTTQTFEFKIQP
jgi:uncharacterized protein with NRDE domain